MPRKSTAPFAWQEDWLARLRESSHDVFLAGLASLARSRGAAGAKLVRADFDALVAEGRKLEPDLRETVQKTWDDLRERSRSTMAVVPLPTEGRLQGVFQERVAAAVRGLGLPTRAELDALSAKLDRLLKMQPAAAPSRKAKVAAKKATPAAAPRKVAAGKTAPRKTAPRKTAPRKSASRKTTPR